MIDEIPLQLVIIDDDHFHGELLAELCKKHSKISARVFHEPAPALQFIKDNNVRIVLIDINMPGMYGDDVLRECMALKQGIQAYIITGTNHMAIADRCLNIGARIIIRKPVSQEAIDEALHDAQHHLARSKQTIFSFATKKISA